MSLASSIRSLVPLVIGLVVGGVGVSLFMDSLPGSPKSPEERASKLEVKLTKAENRVRELEAVVSDGTNRYTDPRRSFGGAGSIYFRIKSGQRVSPEEIWQAVKPVVGDLFPIFNGMRLRDQRRRIDRISGEIARKYDLTPEQQKGLKAWFDAKAKEEAKRWSQVVASPNTRLEDVMRASRDPRPDDGLDAYMEGVLTGDKLADFKKERMDERVARVQHEADMKVHRLDSIVGLNDAQRDQLFAMAFRSSRDYDPSMTLEGPAAQFATGGKAGTQEMLAVLTPDQRAAYEAERNRRHQEAEAELNTVGLTVPPDWDLLDDDRFR